MSLTGYAFSFNDRWVLENTCEKRGYTYLRISLLKCKMHLHLHDSIRGHLHYATVKFKVKIYIFRDSLRPKILDSW
jgi:hypothetical protein